MGIHVELTYLVIPTKNDGQEEIERFCQWVRDRMGVDTPVHFSRFHPDYKMENLPLTPRSTMEMALQAAKGKGLEYVYIGNMATEKGESTFCPKCGSLLIRRTGFTAEVVGVKGDLCAKCGRGTDIVW
jgi:pyruvate formate lyase activating enzyme